MRYLVAFAILFASLQLSAKRLVGEYKIKKGQKFGYEVSLVQTPIMTVGVQASSNKITKQYEISYEVKEQNKENFVLLCQLKRYKTQTSKHPSGLVLQTEWEALNMDSLVNKYVLNRTYFIRMDKAGNLLNITEPNYKIGFYDMDSVSLTRLMEFANKSNFASLIQPTLVVYPRNDVVMGDSWVNKQLMNGGIPVAIHESLSIRNFNKSTILFGINSTVTIENALLGDEKSNFKEVYTKGTGAGNLSVDAKSLMLVQKNTSSHFSSKLIIDHSEVSIDNTIDTKVRIITD